MDRDVARQCAVVAGVAAGIASGATGDYGSARDSTNPLVPADAAFIIWAPIYAGAIAYAVHQARPSRRDDPVLRRTAWPFAAAVALSGTWVRLQDPPQAQIPAVLATTASAALALVRSQPRSSTEADPAGRWLVRGPIGLLAGWLALAAPVATSEALAASGVSLPDRYVDPAAAATLAATGCAAVLVRRRLAATTSFAAATTWGLASVAGRAAHRWPATATAAGLAAVAIACAPTVPARSRTAARARR